MSCDSANALSLPSFWRSLQRKPHQRPRKSDSFPNAGPASKSFARTRIINSPATHSATAVASNPDKRKFSPDAASSPPSDFSIGRARCDVRHHAKALFAAAALLSPSLSYAQNAGDKAVLATAAAEAERDLRQTFTNLEFEDFGPAPVTGPIYQASAGGRVIYYAPESEHLLFASIFDKNGVNLTALAQEAGTAKRLKTIDTAQALAIGPEDVPTVIEFTDPDCPYCRALDRYWAAKVAEGKPVRRLVFFVSGIHPEAAAKAEHILCSTDKAAAFKAVYAGAAPAVLRTCASGREKVEEHARIVSLSGITGTPTLIAGGKLISGFQQAEIETFLSSAKTAHASR